MRAERVARVLALLFFLALTWPILGLADDFLAAFGVPALLAYVFGAWALLVLALAAVSRYLGD